MRTISSSSLAIVLFLALLGSAVAGGGSSGEWSRQEYKIAGSWSIVEQDGKLFVKLSEDFKTRSGPDLKIFFSPRALDSLSGKNVTTDGVLVARLRSHKGAQSYAIPPGIEPGSFKSIVIHCEKYSTLWGGASL